MSIASEAMQKMLEVYEEKDLEACMRTYDDDVIYSEYGVNNAYQLKKPEIRDMLQAMFDGMKNLKFKVHSVHTTSEGDIVAEFSYTFEYVKDVSYFTVPKATGKEVTVHGLQYIKIVEDPETGEKRRKQMDRYTRYYFEGEAPRK